MLATCSGTHSLQLSVRVRVALGQQPLPDLLQLLLLPLAVPLVRLGLLFPVTDSLLQSASPGEEKPKLGENGGRKRNEEASNEPVELWIVSFIVVVLKELLQSFGFFHLKQDKRVSPFD